MKEKVFLFSCLALLVLVWDIARRKPEIHCLGDVSVMFKGAERDGKSSLTGGWDGGEGG